MVNKYYKFSEVISSLNLKQGKKLNARKKFKISDLKVIALSLAEGFISVDSENSLFKDVDLFQIPNLIERRQYANKFMFDRPINHIKNQTI